jgi:hypothetical protein
VRFKDETYSAHKRMCSKEDESMSRSADVKNPTNSEHAARLREMAEIKRLEVQEWSNQAASQRPWTGLSHEQCRTESMRCELESATLLAGAAALEAVDLAKGTLRQIASGQSWSPTRDAAEELANLEAL